MTQTRRKVLACLFGIVASQIFIVPLGYMATGKVAVLGVTIYQPAPSDAEPDGPDTRSVSQPKRANSKNR